MLKQRDVHIELLWNLTESLNVLHPDVWTRRAVEILNNYTRHVYDANNVDGWDVDRVGDDTDAEQWSYAGSLLYSITVITTIGQYQSINQSINLFVNIASAQHTHPFNGPFSGTTQVSHYQRGKTNLDFVEARDSEWQWHQLGHMQVCTLLQTDNHSSTPPLCFLQAGCPSCRPTNTQ